ncbi:esterase-like activity of phytase family protein [Falsirhodobacter halotolerans]|uniref:esterase-like activity of phytase family protein n=1 Tax=Falsirhodobacter halotolerans TaxID=1146892 RepID=UPI001FCFA522|nr:esterase-like activity of phytase family protein [Falsirhodobacter halotolerans]MCJ8141162.1 esterase-like activity of phytase family protein [Falsirhodobacter halotolerans]
MNRLLLTSVLALVAAHPALADTTFNRIASFATPDNMAMGEDRARETSAEIISVSEDGMTLVYSDSPLGVLGFVDITDPAAPKPLGNVAMEGEPTTAVIIGDRVFVGVDTTTDLDMPSGALRMLDLNTEEVLESCDLGGQPDSVAKAKDGSFLAVAIENQRDEDENDGALPQMPAGFVVKLPVVDGTIDCAAVQTIDVTGLADIHPEDPEPEYVDVNDAGEIVVTLQENNHVIIIGADGRVASHFSAGTVDLDGIDAQDDKALNFTDSLTDVPREPDGVKWLGTDHIVTANEGDWKGGSRGWTIFDRDGGVVYDSGNSFELAVAAIGHYPDKRSDAKGVEPETIEIAEFDGTPYIFVVSERGSVIGVYDATDPAAPVLTQLLPSGISPEGLVAIPERNLLVSANEADLGEDGGARAHVMVYQGGDGPAAYPMLTADAGIGWGALSGLALDGDMLRAVSDSVYAAQPAIFTIDPTQTPARIVAKTVVTRDGAPADKLDLEGIVADGQGGFWLASEGNPEKDVPHALIRVDANGAITDEVTLPDDLAAGATRYGFEGVVVVDGIVWLAVQRPWDGDDNVAKLLAYDPTAQAWLGAVAYPLDTAEEGWIGLSDLAVHGDHLYLIERDNLIGEAARLKAITRVALADLTPAPFDAAPVIAKETVHDLIPDLRRTNGFVVDKVEGLTIAEDGTAFVVTDNDGVDDSSGETLFFTVPLN